MDDNHIIRVIIQGYNKLSGVLKNAVDESTPHLDKLNDRLKRNKRSSDDYESSWSKLSRTIERGATEFDVAAIKAERLTNKVKELTRRTKENNEEMKRSQSLLARASATKNKIFEGLSPIDDVFRGLARGARRPEGEDTAQARARIALERELAQLRIQEAEKLASTNRESAIRRKEAVDASLKENRAIRDRLAAEDQRLDKLRSQKELENQILTIKKRGERTTALEGVKGTTDKARKQREQIKIDAASEIAARDAALRDEVRKIESERARLHRDALAEINQEKTARIAAVNETATKSRNSVRESFRESRRVARESFSTDKENLPNLIRQQERDARSAIRGIESGTEKFSAKIGKAFGDFRFGLKGGRKALAELEGEAGKAQSRFTRFGAEIGRITKDINKLVNVRWNLIIGALQVFGTLTVEAGANLVSLASSAVFAAGALGGALVAGIMQAIPVVGLLAATFQELQNAIKVVQLRQKANNAASVDTVAQAKAQKSAVQGLADAHYALKQAQQGVVDANRGIRDSHEQVADAVRNQKDAIVGLADARKQASQAIVDAALEERDAELSLKEAQLGVLDAKQKLKDFEDRNRRDQSSLKDAQAAVKEAQQRLIAAKAEGNAAEISAAQVQLGVASQNVGSIQDQIAQTSTDHRQLVLGVQQSQLTLEKARITRNRAVQDNAKRRREGVEGSPEVKAALDTQRNAARQYRNAVEGITAAQQRRVDAEHNVAQAIRGIANAQDEVTAASGKMSAAQRNAQREFNKLSIPERRFVLAAERLVKAWKKVVRPLTDIITESITRLIGSVIGIISDPKIQGALKRLADQIAAAVDKFGDFLSDPETRRQLLVFIDEAAKNMPTIVNLFMHLLRIVTDIGEAAGPIFAGLLGGADSLLGRAEQWAAPRRATTNSRDPRLSRLEAPGQTTPGATYKPKSPLQSFLETANKNLGSWLKLIGAITRFFTYLFGASEPSGNSLVGQLTQAFNKWADWIRDHPQRVRKFFEDMRVALTRISRLVGKLAQQLLEAFSSKNAQAYTEFILTVIVPALLTMLGFIQLITSGLVAMTKIPVIGPTIKDMLTFVIAAGFLVKLFPVLKALPGTIRAIGRAFLYTIGFMTRFYAVAREVGIAEALAALPISAWVIAILAIIGLIIILDRRLHFIRPSIEYLGKLFKRVGNDIIEGFQHPIRWLKEHWKGLLFNVILGPFGLITAAILKLFPGLQSAITNGFKHALSGIGGVVKIALDGFVNAFKKIPNRIGDALKSVGDKLKSFFSGIHIHVKTKFGIPIGFSVTTDKNSAAQRPGGGGDFNAAERRATGGVAGSQGRTGGPGGTDTVPAWLTPGEWVLNKAQQLRISRSLGMSVEAARMFLFGSQGASPATGTVSGNSVSEHGLWQGFRNLDLHTATDSNGNEVHFIRFKDGTWGQITGRAANRISQTKGAWTPGYANRAASIHGGFAINPATMRRIRGLRTDAFDRRFAMGGVVSAMSAGRNMASSYQSPAGRGGNVVHQNFNVNSEGESDWNSIMRIGAIHAQEAY